MTTELLSPPLFKNKLVIPREEAVKLIKAQIEKGIPLKELRIRSVPELDKARELKTDWTQFTTALLTQMFDGDDVAELFNRWVGKILPEYADLSQFIEHFNDEMDQRLNRLAEILDQITGTPEVVRAKTRPSHAAAPAPAPVPEPTPVPVEYAEVRPQVAVQPAPAPAPAPSHAPAPFATGPQKPAAAPAAQQASKQPARGANRVAALVVHSRDEALEKSLVSFVKMLGYDLLLIEDTQDDGKSMISKLAQHPLIAFVILLPTPDDVAASRHVNGMQMSSSCQKWTFELGYCVGKLSAERVIVLDVGGNAMTYDDNGILYIPIDQAEGWQLQLARQLKRSGIDVDLNRLC